jgi:hypothetical protein
MHGSQLDKFVLILVLRRTLIGTKIAVLNSNVNPLTLQVQRPPVNLSTNLQQHCAVMPLELVAHVTVETSVIQRMDTVLM